MICGSPVLEHFWMVDCTMCTWFREQQQSYKWKWLVFSEVIGSPRLNFYVNTQIEIPTEPWDVLPGNYDRAGYINCHANINKALGKLGSTSPFP